MSFVRVQSMELTPIWAYGESTLKIFSSAAFYEYTIGLYVGEGNLQNVNSFCQSIACELNGTTLTLPEFTLATTVDSSVPTALMSAGIYDSNNVLRYTMLDQFFVDPYYFQSPAQSSVTVDSGGSVAINGNYTYRGQHNNLPYYNLEGQADSTSLYAIFWSGIQWRMTDAAGTVLYTGTSAGFPWDAIWSVNLGSSPAPNVNENQELVVATWEQLTISNQGSGTVYPFGLPGPFWNVPQIKQYVNSLVGDGTTPFMSTLVAGKGAIDTAPALSTFPIVVGINSNRINRVLSEDYDNDLAAAITDIGSTPTTLIIKEDANVTAPRTIPSTLYLQFENGARLVKTSTGTLTFLGLGIENADSVIPVFEGFSAGQVVWTGTVFPHTISTELFYSATASLTTRYAMADAAMAGKYCVIKCYPRTITGNTTITSGHTAHFTPGTYLNTNSTGNGAFYLQSNVRIYGDNAFIAESSINDNGEIFGIGTLTVSRENIVVEGLIFIAGAGLNNAGNQSTIILGNCKNSAIRNCTWLNTKYYACHLGGYGTDGNRAENSVIENNFFIGVGTQVANVLNGINLVIRGNIFDQRNASNSSAYTVIDVEPNLDTDSVENITIEDNLIYLPDEGYSRTPYGIIVQAGPIASVKGAIVRNNTILGTAITPEPANIGPWVSGIQMIGVLEGEVYGNHIRSSYALPLLVQGCRYVDVHDNTLIQCTDGDHEGKQIFLDGVAASNVYDNVLTKTADTSFQQDNGIYESEIDYLATASGSTFTNLGGASYGGTWHDFFPGLTVLFNNTEYVIDTYVSQSSMTATTSIGTVPAKTFTSADVTTGSGNIAIASHPFITGAAVRPTGADLPSNPGLVDGTIVYVISVDANNIKLATTLANALANAPMTYSDAGSGTSTLTPILTSRFSSNLYWDNLADQGITLEPTGSSQILGDVRREIRDSLAVSITSNQNNYAPSRNAHRLDFTTDASRNLTGLVFTSPPQLNGERHEIFNAGSFNLVLVNNATSTAANRFQTVTGADITLTPGNIAYLEYDSTVARWIVWASVIEVGQIPSAIPATKIANGSVSDAEFQRLDGVTSGIQAQLDAKAPLVAPSFTTPALGVATGTSLAASGALSGGTLAIGSGTALTKVLRGSVTIDPASITATTVDTQTFTLTGAVAGDSLILNGPTAGIDAGVLICQAWVSGANAIKITFNNTTGGAIDIASATWFYTLIRS